MQWTGEPNAGFCPEETRPWLPVHPSYRSINAEAENDDPDSLYNCYRRFLSARRDIPALHRGSLELSPPGAYPENVLAYNRSAEPEGAAPSAKQVTVLLNFSKRRVSFQGPYRRPELIVSTCRESRALDAQRNENHQMKIELAPFEGIVIREAEVV
jgi:glycosidase